MAMSKEQKERVKFLLPAFIKLASQAFEYSKSWSPEYGYEHVQRVYANLLEELGKLNIDFNNLSESDCRLLGFSLTKTSFLKDSSKQPEDIWLVPLYLYKLIPKGTKLVSLFGEEVVAGRDYLDNDNRGGCLAFGVKAV